MTRKILLLLFDAAGFIGFMGLMKFDICPLPIAAVLLLLFHVLVVVVLNRSERGKNITEIAKHRSRRILQWPVAFVAAAALLVIVKLPWFAFFRVDARELASGRAGADVLSRRAHLLDLVVNENFSPASSPVFMAPVMRKEWAIGTLSMTAMALANIAFDFPETRESSLGAVEAIVERMLREDIRSFEIDWWGKDALEALEGDNGNIGYLGHLNLILGAQRFLGGDERYEELYTRITSTLVRRIEKRAFPFLDTFPGMIFTADNAVVVASIRLYDRIHKSNHDVLVRRWTDFTTARLIDPRSGGIVFYVSQEGEPLGKNRGSAAGWFSFYLPFIDEELAKLQFERMTAALGREVLGKSWSGGFSALREYLPGEEGPADVDSGPVVFGLSTSGSGFAMAGARRWGDIDFLQGLLNTAELVGTTVQWRGRRCYLIAPLIGDAIVLAMKTARPWDERFVRFTVSETEYSCRFSRPS